MYANLRLIKQMSVPSLLQTKEYKLCHIVSGIYL